MPIIYSPNKSLILATLLSLVLAPARAEKSAAEKPIESKESQPMTHQEYHNHSFHHGRRHLGPGLSPTNDEVFSRAREYRFSGYPDKALALLNKSAEKYKQNAQYFVERAGCNLALKNTRAALADCNEAIKIDANLAHAYSSRAYCFAQQEKFNEAAADYSQVIKLNPLDAGAYINRGLAYRKLGKLKEAAADMKHYRELTAGRENTRRDFNLLFDSNRMEKSGDSRKAAEFLQAQVKAQPSTLVLLKLADLYDKDKQPDKALTALNQAVDLAKKEEKKEPRHLKLAYTTRAAMLMKRKKFTEAAQDFTALIDGSEPDCQETAIRESARGFRSYALGARADCYHQLHLSDKALADINQALAITPKSPQLLKTRADIYSEAGKYGEAINDLSKALEIADRNGLRLDRARLYAKQNDWPSAIKDYSSIIESDRGFLKEALNGRAAAYNATKQSQAAQADLARAQKLD